MKIPSIILDAVNTSTLHTAHHEASHALMCHHQGLLDRVARNSAFYHNIPNLTISQKLLNHYGSVKPEEHLIPNTSYGISEIGISKSSDCDARCILSYLKALARERGIALPAYPDISVIALEYIDNAITALQQLPNKLREKLNCRLPNLENFEFNSSYQDLLLEEHHQQALGIPKRKFFEFIKQAKEQVPFIRELDDLSEIIFQDANRHGFFTLFSDKYIQNNCQLSSREITEIVEETIPNNVLKNHQKIIDEFNASHRCEYELQPCDYRDIIMLTY